MKKGGALIIGGIITLVVLVGGYFAADTYLRSKGMSVFGVIKAIFAVTSSPKIGNNSWDNLNLTDEQRQEYEQSKNSLEFILNGFNFSEINENENITQLIKNVFGENYTMYLYTFIKFEGEDYPLVEWTFTFLNGTIGSSLPGKPKNPDINVGIGQEIVEQMGSASGQEQIMEWLSQGKIKVYPFSQVIKLTSLLPQVMPLISQ